LHVAVARLAAAFAGCGFDWGGHKDIVRRDGDEGKGGFDVNLK